MKHYGIEGTLRASFALYNTTQEIDALVAGIQRVKQLF
jgi:cysteine desulfurase/selenocysteine lyase